MTKDEVKLLCETNELLEWWAMVLFAEISELVSVGSGYRDDDRVVANYVRGKVDEFPKIVLQEVIREQKAKEK